MTNAVILNEVKDLFYDLTTIMATPLDSAIFKPLFTDDEISALLSDGALVRALVEVEIALARAEARAGVIPAKAAEQIAKASAEKVDIAALTQGQFAPAFRSSLWSKSCGNRLDPRRRRSFIGARRRRISWTQPAFCSCAQ